MNVGDIIYATDIKAGTLSTVASTAGATNTAVELSFSATYNANIGTNVTAKTVVGPAITALSTTMTGATTGFLKKTGADTYSLDTNTYLTSYSDTDTTYSISAETGTGGVNLRLTAGGSGSGTDDVLIANGTGVTCTRTDANTITIGIGQSVGTASNVEFAQLKTINLTTGAAATAGSITGNWSLSSGSKLQSTYADLAEYYTSDQEYEPGTVLIFGGEQEVTVSNKFEDKKLAGVVTTNPAYILNSSLTSTKVCLALQGRVPVKVVGKIEKGDMITTSNTKGYATKSIDNIVGTIIGKALQNKDTSGPGVIEVALGRV